MLTRLEINGFRTFEDFALDLEPFLVVLGANNSGKSNFLEAIHLLSGLASSDVATAFRRLRGDVSEVFRWGAECQPGRTMTLAAEVLLSPSVQVGTRQLPVPHTRIRYEVEIERGPGDEDVRLVREEARPIEPHNDAWANRPTVSPAFRTAYLRYARTAPWLPAPALPGVAASTGNGAAGARPCPATVLAGLADAADVCLLALRAELRSWRLLHLELSALRKPTPPGTPQELGPDGSNLPGYLARILAETATDDWPDGALGEISMLARGVAPGTPNVAVVSGTNGELRLVFHEAEGRTSGARAASDGALRMVALIAVLSDPSRCGLLCVEEAENGLTPARQARLVELVRTSVSDLLANDSECAVSLFQVLFMSRSPALLVGLEEEELAVFAEIVSRTDPVRRCSRKLTRMRRVLLRPGATYERGKTAARIEVESFLAQVPIGS